MIISEELKKNNIAEYILYMWQTEDMIRSFDFDMTKIKNEIIDNYDVSEELKNKISFWYEGFIRMMELENTKTKGHIQVLKNIVDDLNDLHLWLLTQASEIKYKNYYETALPNIKALAGKMNGSILNEIDICLHGLYAILLLKLQNKPINPETKSAIDTFRFLIARLSSKYHDREEFPEKYYK